ncbi:hypothetical protein CYMTET_21087 [Cymbomonas tetramitiformis]|uniref:Photosystem I reaction center subunit III n=1 Tax=Cymbomonas tetramitiformis TaxID=36881 RepID=A0AAE0G2U5_9CHLO|nr:hypothetical protein CYMTET_21087 [Cymbomonas tetramitiformis]|eukprot:gene15512-18379_t
MAFTMSAKAPVACKNLSSKGSFNPLKIQAARPVPKAARVEATCSADLPKKVVSGLAAAAIAASVPLAAPQEALADVAGLTPCSESKAYRKKEKQELKALKRRLKQYDPESAPALALEATIAKTEQRFDNYASYGLLCGADGLPHLIVDGDLNHLGEFVIPGIGFLYVAGWIGYAGRDYLLSNKGLKKPTQAEIIIDVPKALPIMFRAGAWPLMAFNELKNGTLTESKENITVSPR